jgi:hypothetical protein
MAVLRSKIAMKVSRAALKDYLKNTRGYEKSLKLAINEAKGQGVSLKFAARGNSIVNTWHIFGFCRQAA